MAHQKNLGQKKLFHTTLILIHFLSVFDSFFHSPPPPLHPLSPKGTTKELISTYLARTSTLFEVRGGGHQF